MAPIQVVGAAPPPPGVTPNFEDPVSVAYRVYPTIALGSFLSISFLALRIYTKVRIIRKFGLDDGEFNQPMLTTVNGPLILYASTHHSGCGM